MRPDVPPNDPQSDGPMPSLGNLAERRARQPKRSRRAAAQRTHGRPTLYFDLASPHTYLAAERAESLFSGLQWCAASARALDVDVFAAEDRARVAERANELGLPLVWPVVDAPMRVPSAMRVAALAIECGRGGSFVLAASRLTFCGGFDIEDPVILCDAAGAANLDIAKTLEAANDARRDLAIATAGRRLLDAGADRLPVLEIAGKLYCGEERLIQAATAG